MENDISREAARAPRGGELPHVPQADKLSPYYRWFNFERWPDRYVGWFGVKSMPEFVECPEVEDFFFGPRGVARHRLSYGTAGWRTDVTPWITHEFWRRFRRSIREQFPEAYIVAKDWGNSSERLLGDSYDATMNYRFGYSAMGYAAGKLSPAALDDRLETLRRDTPQPFFHTQLNLLGSHDTSRLLNKLRGDRQRLKLAVALQMAYPGVPMVYYGDEAGIEGLDGEDGRRAFPWDSPDQDLVDFHRRAISARRQSPALSRGEVRTAWIEDRAGYGLIRTWGDERILALFNSSAAPLEVELDLGGGYRDGDRPDLLGSKLVAGVSSGAVRVTLPECGAGWFRLTPETAR